MLKYLLLLKSIIFTISGNVCPEYQFYCNTLQKDINNVIHKK